METSDPAAPPPRLDEHQLRRLLEGDGTVLSAAVRAALYIPGKLYGHAMALRRRAYDAGVFQSRHAGVPTISVGNLTAGGSGKTPTVAALARELLAAGHRPGILLRGYVKSAADSSDEAALYRDIVPRAILAVNPNRRQGARAAKEQGATVLLMDDGFQHRKLRRDLDIVLIDATSPWGGGNTIPGGLLREPKSALAAADAVIVTRSDQVDAETLVSIKKEIARLAPHAVVFVGRHRPVRLRTLDGREWPLASLDGRNVVALAGIARPEAFVKTLAQLGAATVAVFAKADHHPMEQEFVLQAARAAAGQGGLVVTTEKDFAKPVFQHLRGRMADNTKGEVEDARAVIRILGVEQEIAGVDDLIGRILHIAPTH